MITCLHILDIHLSEPIMYTDMIERLENRSENANSWFTEIEICDQLLRGEFYYRSYTFIWTYDEKNNKPVKEKTLILNSVKFALDFELYLMEFYGSKNEYSKFVRALVSRLSFIYSISTPQIKLKKFYQELNDVHEVILLGITLTDFELDNQLIGKYIGRLSRDKSQDNVMSKYADKIEHIQLKLVSFDDVNFIDVNKSANYKINSNLDDLASITNILKTIQKKSYA